MGHVRHVSGRVIWRAADRKGIPGPWVLFHAHPQRADHRTPGLLESGGVRPAGQDLAARIRSPIRCLVGGVVSGGIRGSNRACLYRLSVLTYRINESLLPMIEHGAAPSREERHEARWPFHRRRIAAG